MKNVKALLKKCLDSKECFENALAEFRTAPREDGYSPAELFYKRQVRGLLPELHKKLNVEEAERARDKVQETLSVIHCTASNQGCQQAPCGRPEGLAPGSAIQEVDNWRCHQERQEWGEELRRGDCERGRLSEEQALYQASA